MAAHAALDENVTHYKQEIQPLFAFNSLLIASNGTDSRRGSLTADWKVLAHGYNLLGACARTPNVSGAQSLSAP